MIELKIKLKNGGDSYRTTTSPDEITHEHLRQATITHFGLSGFKHWSYTKDGKACVVRDQKTLKSAVRAAQNSRLGRSALSLNVVDAERELRESTPADEAAAASASAAALACAVAAEREAAGLRKAAAKILV